MTSKQLLISLTLTAVLSTGCGLFSGPNDNSGQEGSAQERFNITLKNAETAYAEADKMGGAWAYTDELIKDAKQKAAQNQFDEAIALAKEALFQSRSAKEQVEGQQKAGPYLF